MEKENKTKVKKSNKTIRLIILIVTGLTMMLLAVAFGSKILLNNNANNNNSNNNNNNNSNNNPSDGLNTELKGLYAFAINNENESLVALTTDGKEVVLGDLSIYEGNYFFDYYNKKIYLYIDKYDDNNDEFDKTLAYIDLTVGNGNYTIKTISDFNLDNDASSIAVLGDKIYVGGFKTNVGSEVKIFSISKKEFSDLNVEKATKSLPKLFIRDNYLIYEIDDNIYTLNVNNNEKKQIVSNATACYDYNGKFIYMKYASSEDFYHNVAYYEYDFKTKESKIISNKFDLMVSAMGLEQIVAYNNGYIYAEGDKLVLSNGTFETLYQASDGIASITRVGSNKLLLTTAEGMDEAGISIMFDLQTKTATTLEKHLEYSYVIYYE